MKTRRLLAIVLCFVMLFSDAISTFASTTSGESIDVTELSDTGVTSTEEDESLTESETVEDMSTMEEDTDTTEEAGTESGNEPESATEVVTAYYQENNATVAEFGLFTNFGDALKAINDYLTLNPESIGTMYLDMLADVSVSEADLVIESSIAGLVLNLNGHMLMVEDYLDVQADIYGGDTKGQILAVADSSISIRPSGTGNTASCTVVENVEILFEGEERTGYVKIGRMSEEGELLDDAMLLSNVLISNAKDVVLEGQTAIQSTAPNTYALNAENITFSNANEESEIEQFFTISVPVNCEILEWNGNGIVDKVVVADSLVGLAGSNLYVNEQLTVNDIQVTRGEDKRDSFTIANRYLHKADGELESKAVIIINGNITYEEGMESPIMFCKEYAIWETESNGEDSQIVSEGYVYYEQGEVIATAPLADRSLMYVDNEEREDKLFVSRDSEGKLIAEKLAVEVAFWNDEYEQYEKSLAYASWDLAVEGMKAEFNKFAGQYIITIYEDIKLTNNVELPEYMRSICIEPDWEEVGTFDEINFVNMDFNGHSILANGTIIWSEAITMTNSAETNAEVNICSEDGFFVETLCLKSGEIEWPVSEYTFNKGVNINAPKGFVDLSIYEVDTTTHILDAEVTAQWVSVESGAWKVTDFTLVESENNTYIKEGGNLTVTGTTIITGGNGIEVRGKLQLGDVFVKANSKNPAANLRLEIGKVYDADKNNEHLYTGEVIFTGTITAEESASDIISISKNEIYVSNIRGEEVYAQEVSYTSGEELAVIKNSSITSDKFALNIPDTFLSISGERLKVSTVALQAAFYDESEDKIITFRYETLKDAFVQMENDFGGREGLYTITLIKDIKISEDMVVPSFITELVLEAAISNKIDLNGYTISSNGTYELRESLEIISTAEEKGQIISNAVTSESTDVYGAVVIAQTVLENVDVVAQNGVVQLWADGTEGIVVGDIIANTVDVSGKWSVENLSIAGGKFYNRANTLLVCDTFTQTEKGLTYLEGTSVLVVKKEAVINNLYITDCAYLYRANEAKIQINGKVERQNEFANLCFGIYEETEESWTFITLERNEVLFTTDIEEFPTEWLCFVQDEENAKYESAYQVENEDGVYEVLVGGNWILVSSLITIGDESKQQELASFNTWSEAIKYINDLANPNIGYVIELTEDINADDKLELPENVLELIVCSGIEEQVTLTCEESDITITADTCFENVKLVGIIDIEVEDGQLLLAGVTADFGKVEGNGENILAVTRGSSITVEKITDLAELALDTSVLIVEKEFAEVEELHMQGSTLKANGKIAMNDIVSYDDKNQIITKENVLKIKGTISGVGAGEVNVAADYSIGEAAKGKEIIDSIRAYAIDIVVESNNGVYTTETKLLEAENAASAWFVVGSKYDDETGDRIAIESLTHKKGNANSIYYGRQTVEKKAVSVRVLDWDAADWVLFNSYATLEDAFDAIEDKDDNEAIYYITLAEDVVLDAFETPESAVQIQIWAGKEDLTITYDEEMVLNSHLLLGNIILNPDSEEGSIDLGEYGLDLLCGTTLAEGCEITSVTGNGVDSNSVFNVHNTVFTISGDIVEVGEIWIQSAELIVEGAVDTGNLMGWVDTTLTDTQKVPTLVGTAEVSKPGKKITDIKTQITIRGEVCCNRDTVTIALREEKSAGKYEYIDFSKVDEDMWDAGVQLVNAPKADSMMIVVSEQNMDDEAYVSAKANGYIVCQHEDNIGVILGYEKSYGKETVKVYSGYRTFEEAITQINALAVKQEYEILLQPGISGMSQEAPITFKMPKANVMESLVIKAESEEVIDLYYKGNITLTSDLRVESVAFRQADKNGKAYGKKDMPAAVTISTAGNDVTFIGEVIFNTPIKLDGKKKGNLNIVGTDAGILLTETYNATDSVFGSITNFAEVNVVNAVVEEEEVRGIFLAQFGKTAPTFSAAALNVYDNAYLGVVSSTNKAKLTVTDLTVSNGNVSVDGTVTAKNTKMYGESAVDAFGKMTLTNVTLNDTSAIRGDADVTISGTLICNTPNAVLRSKQKSAKNLKPGLNIKGKVLLSDPSYKINVEVEGYDTDNLVKLTDAPKASGLLLTAKSATTEMFVPSEKNAGKNAYPENKNGYILAKSGTGIYVYYGNTLAVEVSREGEVLGYYNTVKDAVKAIDAWKEKEAVYVLRFLNEVGDEESPVAMTMPKNAKEIVLQSEEELYLTGNLKLNASPVLTLLADTVITGNVSGKGILNIGRDVTVMVNGSFAANNVVFNGESVLDAQKNKVTIGAVENNGSENQIIYGKDKAGAPNLTIKGMVSGESENPILLKLMSSNMNYKKYKLSKENGQVKLDNKQKIASIEKAALSNFIIAINSDSLDVRQVVKANKGIYYYGESGITLEIYDDETYVGTSVCLDYAQAINEINAIADKTASYHICFDSIEDTNITDKKPVSAIIMPKANVAAEVKIISNSNDGGMEFTGNITYAGILGLVNCELKVDKISSVKELILEDTKLITAGDVKVGDVVVEGKSTWDAFGATTIANLDVTGAEFITGDNSEGSYLASKQNAKGDSTFTITGNVKGVSVWKVIKADAKDTTDNKNRYITDYKDESLVIAKAAGADRFLAESFVKAEGIRAYKDIKNAVRNGDAEEMKVLLAYNDTETYTKSFEEAIKLIDNIGNKEGEYEITFLSEEEEVTTKIASAYGALTLPKKAASVHIMGMPDSDGNPSTTLKYTGTMKTTVDLIFSNIILTEGKVDKVSGRFVPSYAVTPVMSNAQAEIRFAEGALTLKETNNEDAADLVFTSVSGKGNLLISDRTAKVEGALAANILTVNNASVEVENDVKVTTLHIADNAALETAGKFTAKDVYVLNMAENEQRYAVVDADSVITITNVSGEESGDGLLIVTNRTQDKDASQLTISGLVLGTEVDVAMNIYDDGEYREMTAEDIAEILITDEKEIPVKEQALIIGKKLSSGNIGVAAFDEKEKCWIELAEISTYAQDGNVYMTDIPVLVQVYGINGDKLTYNSNFINWNQAVKEIDSLNNKKLSYEMNIQRNVGQNADGTLEPIAELTLPAKAKEVIVTGNIIFLEESTISPKVKTIFTNVGLMAVEENRDGYESVSYDVNVGNCYVEMNNITGITDIFVADYGWITLENIPGTISGAKKGHFVFHWDDEGAGNDMAATMINGVGTVEFWDSDYTVDMDDAETDVYTYVNVPEGITGAEKLIVHPFVQLESVEGAISVKNIIAKASVIHAKDVEVKGSADLASAWLEAGTESIGDGFMKIANVVLQDAESGLSAKQDENGNSLLQITGKISMSKTFADEKKEALQIEVRYNNDSASAQLYDGMLLLTAPKADVTVFKPLYSGMGGSREGYGLYKEGKANVYYGALNE
ncbi:MAG: hypothetical protein IKW08_09000 [Roseburia sp.]|nr:hypothetical protein [Roseburia sp.]